MICAECTAEVEESQVCLACGGEPLLRGEIRLEEVIGQGAAGTTFRGVAADGAVVAVKELLFHRLDSLKTQELFEREGRILRQLDHRAIPDYVDSFTVESGRSASLYLVQEFIDGRTLQEEMEERRYSEGEVLAILEELAAITEYLHGLMPPVVHRDIKPSNIMRRANDGRLVLIDFGSVRDAMGAASGDATIAGTFGFMAPEQFQGGAEPATDVYGMGVTAVSLMCRLPPASMVGPDGRLDWEGRAPVSPGLRKLLEEMLDPIPGRRPTSGEVIRRIGEVRRGGAGPVRHVAPAAPAAPAAPVAPVARSGGAHRHWLLIAAVLVAPFGGMLIVGGLVFLVARSLEPEEESVEAAARVVEEVAVEHVEEARREEDREEEEDEEEELPEYAEVLPDQVGVLRLGMTLEELQETVPADQIRRGGRGRPMPPGETYDVEISLAGDSAQCSVHFTDGEGLSSLSCRQYVTFSKEEYDQVEEELVSWFRERYGSHTRYFRNRDAGSDAWWWTHPEAELLVRMSRTDREMLTDREGHGTRGASLESAAYQEWHEEDERQREERRRSRR